MEIEFHSSNVEIKGERISAKKDGVEIGHIYIYFLRNDSNDQPFAFGEDLYVKEGHRREGVARILAGESIRRARELGCYKYLGISRFGRDDQHRRLESYGLDKWGYEFRLDFDSRQD